MATLYTQQQSNIWKTWSLMAGFFVLVILFGWVFSYVYNDSAILYIAVIISILSSVGSYWFSDKLVLSMSNAQEISAKDNPELYRVVENLCITVGLPVPKIYIIDEEQPNAFATGRDEKHAVVAVTRGLLQRLQRSELEGVLAHELSHIRNKDMLLQTVVVVMAGLISIASDFMLRSMFWGGNSDNKDRNPLMLILGIAAIILAPIAATIIQLSISRKREFLADASGALITRYPEGLASALQKIAVDPHEMQDVSTATAHLYIESPLRGDRAANWFSKLFMTHPPVEERIAALKNMNVEQVEKELYGK
ncbi:MAG: M48 family metallopeptidase [Candidatus Paceibacterota bacterium]|jgi:heat shock protein HtpX|nr:M48 family metallopeptidase [bacterium]